MNRFNELTLLDVGTGGDRRSMLSVGDPLGQRVSSLNLDVHQHLWPERLLEALRARAKPPMLRGWTLELAGEAPYEVDPRDHDPDARRTRARQEHLDLALIAPSSPLGIELLPADGIRASCSTPTTTARSSCRPRSGHGPERV